MIASVTNEESKTGGAPHTVNLLNVANGPAESTLGLLKLGYDEKAFILFSADSTEVDLHYCSETEINGYVVCCGPDCVLCRSGRRQDKRLLLPVFVPTEGTIAILPVSRSLRPFALLPQISNVLKAKKPLVVFVTRDGGKYNVSTVELQKDVDSGEAVIKQFWEDFEAGLHDLLSVYPKIDNEELANVEEIGRMMKLKGIKQNAGDKRS